MTPTRRRVALIATAGDVRVALAAYLANAGFEVHQYDELAVASSYGAVVVLNGRDRLPEALRTEVRTWLKLTRDQRVVVVTSKPTVLKDLLAVHGERLRVLAAPVFGWDVVDALRASEPTRPRGA
jgi:hypothetical protein